MAEDQDTSKFKLDLDSSEFISKALSAKSAISEIGNSENLSGLISGIAEAGLAVAALGAAFLAIKGSVEAVFKAEDIKAVRAQFDLLTARAGVYGEELKHGLEEAGHGWVDETELMEAANRALVKLEIGADKLPQLLNIARQAASVMGGTMIEKFDAINNAIATGMTRQLRSVGIIVDQEKAYRDYAKSIGVTVDALGLAERQQAVMNSVLEKGQKDLAGTDAGLRQAQNAWALLKNTMKEIAEAAVVMWDRLVGPKVISAFQTLSGMAGDFKNFIQDTFGTGMEKASAHAKRLQGDLAQLQYNLDALNRKREGGGVFTAEDERLSKILTDQISKYNSELKQTVETEKELGHATEKRAEAEKISNEIKAQQRKELNERQAIENAKAQKDLEHIKSQELQEEIKNMSSIEEARKLYDQQRIQEANQVAAQIEEVNAREKQGHLTASQAEAQRAELRHLQAMKMRKDEQDLLDFEIQAAQKRLQNEKSVDGQITAAFQHNALSAQQAWQKSGQIGGAAVKSFQNQSVAAFRAMGDGSKTASEAMKGAFFGMLADVASAQGEFMMLDAFKTFPAVNLPEFAAGGALVALSGFLGGAASGGSSIPSGGGAGGSGYDVGTTTSTPSANTSAVQKNSVNLIIQGHMLTDERTARWIVDQVRSAADATDFTIKSVTGGFS